MSAAGAISTRPRMRAAASGSVDPSRRSSKRASQPPMLEPTTMRGPAAKVEKACTASASQPEIVPPARSPPDSPWPE
jgi:hypothetical protein